MADDHPSRTPHRSTSSGLAVGPGAILANRYEILEYVGSGGMGVVYKARDRTLDETVAIKILRQHPLDDPSRAQRLLAEIKLARRVTHKNVCRIHDYGEAESAGFISMQFVDGVELKQMVRRRGGLSVGEGYDIALQLVDGLEAIHDQGIVHRDFKTSNVVIDRQGVALLMDFGIAKLWAGEAGAGLTAFGQIVGTPEYMSPEQAQGEPLDPRSDIYSLGVVLYELFTGALPITADNFAAMLYKKVHEPLQLDAAAAAGLPAPLKPVVKKALATAAADRYASTRELRAALIDARAESHADQPGTSATIAARVQSLRDAAPVAATPVPADAKSHRSRGWWLLAGASVAAVALITMIVQGALPFFRAASNQTSAPDQASSRPASVGVVPATEAGRSVSTSTPTSTMAPILPSSDGAVARCDAGDAAACVALAQAAETMKDFGRAADLYLEACNAKAGAACTAFGVLRNRGLGVPRDAMQAAVYYERGCVLGDLAGCNNLGTVYQFGSMGFRDDAKAADLYERACSGGQMDGCTNLGLLRLDWPEATPAEKQRARQLLVTACAAGVARACGRVR